MGRRSVLISFSSLSVFQFKAFLEIIEPQVTSDKMLDSLSQWLCFLMNPFVPEPSITICVVTSIVSLETSSVLIVKDNLKF